jgi:hypothetical protein
LARTGLCRLCGQIGQCILTFGQSFRHALERSFRGNALRNQLSQSRDRGPTAFAVRGFREFGQNRLANTHA